VQLLTPPSKEKQLRWAQQQLLWLVKGLRQLLAKLSSLRKLLVINKDRKYQSPEVAAEAVDQDVRMTTNYPPGTLIWAKLRKCRAELF